MNDIQAYYFLPQEALSEFNKVRQKLYGDNGPPDEINAAYATMCLLLKKGSEPVARLCFYHNPFIGGKGTLLFGNMECIDDAIIFSALLEEASKYAAQQGYDILLGPINGSTWDEYRLPLTAHHQHFLTDLVQPAYYSAYLLQNGFAVVQKYYTHISPIKKIEPDRFLAQKMKEQGIAVRFIDMNDYEQELKKLFPFCVAAFKENVYYSPITEQAFVAKYLRLKPAILPRFVLIAEDRIKNIQGLILCIPDRHQQKRLIIKTIARGSDTALQGLMTYMVEILFNRAVEEGYRHIVHAFMHEENRSRSLSAKFEGQVFKEYGLFQKKLKGR